ncbi:hypothetical protein AcV7_003243 [Taiwanofungus camphoratus]|nr:hypothetical protein AcV7_003243 [Antrodia cinnamomea]
MNLPSLNDDVLSIILSHLSTQDAFNLSATARGLYSVAMRRALYTVALCSPQQLSAFCESMFADVPNRLHSLRNLELSSLAFGVAGNFEAKQTGDFSSAPLLADLLEQAHDLKSISLPCVEYLIQREPRVAYALAALPDLVELRLKDMGGHSLEVIRMLQSTPSKLIMRFDEFSVAFRATLPAIAHLQSLKNLELSFLNKRSAPHNMTIDLGAIPQWLNVRHLTVTHSDVPMSICVRAFPNLQTLHLGDVSLAGESENTICWPTLHRAHGFPADFRHWQLTCPVHELELDSFLFARDMQQQSDTLSVVKNTRPVMLTLQCCTDIMHSFWTPLLQLAPRLRCMEIFVLCGQISLFDIRLWMILISSCLSSSALLFIQICMIDLPEAYKAVILQEFPAAFAESVESAQYISLGFGKRVWADEAQCYRFSGRISWWRVVSSGAEPRTEVLLAEVGERIQAHLHSPAFKPRSNLRGQCASDHSFCRFIDSFSSATSAQLR